MVHKKSHAYPPWPLNTGQYAACCKFRDNVLHNDTKSRGVAFLCKPAVDLERTIRRPFLPGTNCQQVQHNITGVKFWPTLRRQPEEVRPTLQLILVLIDLLAQLPICSRELRWVPATTVILCTHWQFVTSPYCQMSTHMPYRLFDIWMSLKIEKQTCTFYTAS